MLGRSEVAPGVDHACQLLLGGVVEVEFEWKRILAAGDGRTRSGRAEALVGCSVNGVELLFGLEKLCIFR